MARLYLNNYETLLTANVLAGDSVITVGTPPASPGAGNYYRVQLVQYDVNGVAVKREFADITAVSGNDLTVTRAAEGTTALTFDIGDTVQLTETAQSFSGGSVADHVAEPDPHPQYLTEAEGDINYEPKRFDNLSATTDPTVTDDSSAGYEVLSKWLNTTTGEIWLCTDNTIGAANWQLGTLTVDQLGSAALANTTDFATAAQGITADNTNILLWQGF